LTITERARAGIAYTVSAARAFQRNHLRDLLTIATGIEDEKKLLAILRRVGICPLSFLDKEVDAKLSVVKSRK
jgi:Fe-S cluster assembly ATP-binding protein